MEWGRRGIQGIGILSKGTEMSQKSMDLNNDDYMYCIRCPWFGDVKM